MKIKVQSKDEEDKESKLGVYSNFYPRIRTPLEDKIIHGLLKHSRLYCCNFFYAKWVLIKTKQQKKRRVLRYFEKRSVIWRNNGYFVIYLIIRQYLMIFIDFSLLINSSYSLTCYKTINLKYNFFPI